MRIVVLHAHPDDESSKGAGTIAKYSDAGVRCVLVCATGGEAGDILNPAMDKPEIRENLPAVRSDELDEAAKIIGYDRVVRLGYRDSGMPDTEANHHEDAFVNVPFEECLEAVVRIVREERPHVMFAYDEHVRYPHPDHLRIHDLGLAAFDTAADPERFPEAGPPWSVTKLYAPVFSLQRMRELHAAMLSGGLESPFTEWMKRIEDTAEDEMQGEIVSRIDVTETLGRARDALRAHRTQVDPDGFWFQVPLDLVKRVYPYEDFELMAARIPVDGPEDDLLAGI
jgi:mycothiol S-conjugate amidase